MIALAFRNPEAFAGLSFGLLTLWTAMALEPHPSNGLLTESL